MQVVAAGIFHEFFFPWKKISGRKLNENKFHEKNFPWLRKFQEKSWFHEKENSMRRIFHERKIPDRKFQERKFPWKKIAWWSHLNKSAICKEWMNTLFTRASLGSEKRQSKTKWSMFSPLAKIFKMSSTCYAHTIASKST